MTNSISITKHRQTDYLDRAQIHATKSALELRDAAQAMARDGHGDHTIAEALKLDVDGVRRLLGDCRDCES